MTRYRALAMFVALAITCAPEVARAQAAEGPAESEAPAYTLEVDSDAPDVVSFEALAARISSDLGAGVTRSSSRPPSRAAIVVRYRNEDRELSVRASHRGGRVLERTVRVQGHAADVQREAVLLASNLAREEARELLDELAAREPKPAAPERAAEPPPPPAPPAPPETEGEVVASAALFYPVATNAGRPRVATHLDFSLFYGRVGGVRGLELGTGVVYASEYVRGIQIAAGATMAGSVRGVQIGAGAAYASELRGVQIAGGAAIAGTVRGVEIAPANVAHDVTGLQLGVVNVARRVKGAQIGVVNVAEEVDGASIALVSIGNLGYHPVAWSSNLSYANAGIKVSARYVYTFFTVKAGSPEVDLDFSEVTDSGAGLGQGAGLGVHLPIAGSFDLDVETEFAHYKPKGFVAPESNSWTHTRVLPGWSFARHLRVFAGGGFRAPVDVDVGKSVYRPEFMAGVQF